MSCRDADQIPKVDGAGEIVLQDRMQVQVMHEGTRVLAFAYHGAWMSEVIRRLRGHHEPQEELVVHRILERLSGAPNPTIMELGSFWSYYSIWALRSLGSHAVLVEPDPSNLEVSRVNLSLNRVSASVVQAALGGPHGSLTTLVCESDGLERELRVVTVPGLMDEYGLERIDFLLADIQGPETDVVTRALDAIRKRRIRFLVLSTHHHSISGDPLTHQRCLALLQEAGCHVVAEHSVGESFSGDGLIAVSTADDDEDLRVPVSHARHRDSLFGELEPDLAASLDREAALRAELDASQLALGGQQT